MKTIIKDEGAGGLFRGLGPALMTVPLFWGIYFYSYNRMKEVLLEHEMTCNYPMLGHTISAVAAGGVADVITNPLWVTRTRIQTLILHGHLFAHHDTKTIPMMKHIYKREGFFAFYRGLSASFLGLSHVGLQFPLCTYPAYSDSQRIF